MYVSQAPSLVVVVVVAVGCYSVEVVVDLIIIKFSGHLNP